MSGDTWGNVQDDNDYLSFGTLYLNSMWSNGYSDNHYLFTGYESDASESSTSYATFRNLSTSMGRFNRPDPYDGSYHINNPQSLNRYAYVQNNPLKHRDRFGLEESCESDEDCQDCDTDYCVTVPAGDDSGGTEPPPQSTPPPPPQTPQQGGSSNAPSKPSPTPKQQCIQNAMNQANQTIANVQASHKTNLVVGAVGGFLTGAIGNCISGAVVGAAVPIFTGLASPVATVTGPVGCIANTSNPVGLVGGTAGGVLAAYGYDIYQAYVAKATATDTINNVCANLPD
jgi:RHS repeat-associated protein